MDKIELQSLIKQTVNEEILHVRESLADFESIYNNITVSTEIGKTWRNLIVSLENVTNEVKDFRSMYSPALHGPVPANIPTAMQKLQQIVQLLIEIKPVIMGMDQIQLKDR
jgi:phage-related protein